LFSDAPEEQPVKTRWDRIQLLSMFFIFNVLLIFFDIGSDIGNGFNLILRGDVIWGSLTLFFSFCPFLVRFLAILVKLFIASGYKKKKDFSEKRFQQMKLKASWWFSPIVHPFA
jgi:hypothetical protein